MKIRTVVLVAGGAIALAVGGLGAVACSAQGGEANDPTPSPSASSPMPDAGVAPVKPASDSGDGTLGDSGTSDAGAPQDDAGSPGCAKPPQLFPPKPDGGVYCPFSKSGDAGATKYCKEGTQICCIAAYDGGASVPSTCNQGSTCPVGDIPWQCSAPQECAGGQVCCATATATIADPNCPGYEKASKFKGTKCAATCGAAGEFVACEAQADCPAGKTCTAIKATGTGIGFCL